jgi:hypothetical protein
MTPTGPVLDIRDAQVIKDDHTFLVTDRMGDVPEGNTAALGLYHRDTRFLSGLRARCERAEADPSPLVHGTELLQIVELTYPFEAKTSMGSTARRTYPSSGSGSCQGHCSSGSGFHPGYRGSSR